MPVNIVGKPISQHNNDVEADVPSVSPSPAFTPWWLKEMEEGRESGQRRSGGGTVGEDWRYFKLIHGLFARKGQSKPPAWSTVGLSTRHTSRYVVRDVKLHALANATNSPNWWKELGNSLIHFNTPTHVWREKRKSTRGHKREKRGATAIL
jgi:hypothetical protein